jgi:hypothetical protein
MIQCPLSRRQFATLAALALVGGNARNDADGQVLWDTIGIVLHFFDWHDRLVFLKPKSLAQDEANLLIRSSALA